MRSMALKDSIADLIRPAVENAGFFLEDVFTSNPGNHRIVTCMVDGLKPLSLDEVTVVSREISAVEVTDGRSGSFDTRWICDIAEGEWRTLGVEGLARFPNWRDTTEHRNSLLASPSLWNNNELKSAPFLVKDQFCKCRLRDGPKSFFDSILKH